MNTIVFNNPQAYHVYFWLSEVSSLDTIDMLNMALAQTAGEEPFDPDTDWEHALADALAELLESWMSDYLDQFGLADPLDVPLCHRFEGWDDVLGSDADTLLLPLLAQSLLGICYYPIAEALLAKHNEWYEDALKKLGQRLHISVNS